MKEFFSSVFNDAGKLITSVGWNDIVDIIVVAIAIFSMLRLFRKTRTMHLVRGLVLLALVYFAVTVFEFPTSGFIFRKLFSNIVIVLVMLFQPEIRRAIEEFGKGRFNLSMFRRSSLSTKQRVMADISSVVNACIKMSEDRIGALIVFEGRTPMSSVKASGSRVDAIINTEVLENIFFPKAPLHDGAVIIEKDRIHSAGCILPLTERSVNSQLGTRHRAAIGVTESYDCFAIVVSEETGNISLAKGGELNFNLTSAELVELMNKFLLPNDKQEEQK